MRTLKKRPAQLTLVGAALTFAILIFALLVLAGGGNGALASNIDPSPDGDPVSERPLHENEGENEGEGETTPTPTPTATATPTLPPPPQPEGCSAAPARVIDRGHFAVFEAYWDTTDDNLAMNPCPPAVQHHEHAGGVETVTRTQSRINTGHTIMHVASDANLNPEADNADHYLKWPFLYPDAEDKNGDHRYEGAEIGAPYSTGVWALHDCRDGAVPEPTENDLCMGVSAGLLQSGNWNEVRKIRLEMEAFHEPGVNPADRGQAFMFHPRVVEASTDPNVPGKVKQTTELLWGTVDAANTAIYVDAGEYVHPRWIFTKPGTYQFQVHANAVPSARNNLTTATSVTTQVMTYTLHVGDLSNLGVTVAADNATPEAGAPVVYTITASNAGPDPAADVEATVTLPTGLTYTSSQTATGTYDSATGVWSVGNLAKDAEPTLTLTATTGSNTHGQALTVTVSIKASETIGTSTVEELDTDESNNTATAAVTPAAVANTAPVFRVVRSVAENSAAATGVGDPIQMAYDPDTGDTLTYSLSGEGADQFTVAANAEGNPQVAVATGADLDYETTTSYNLRLNVSDGKDADGNADASVDHFIGLLVNVTDVFDHVTLQVTENAAAGTAVGAVVPLILGPGAGTPTYTLSGTGSDKFTAAATAGGAQLTVASGAVINYEDAASYALTLTASDGTVANTKTISVTINVQDVADEEIVVTLSADQTTQVVGSTLTLTATVTNSPYASSQLSYRLNSHAPNETTETPYLTSTTFTVERDSAATVNYWVNVYHGDTKLAESNRVTVTWTTQ